MRRVSKNLIALVVVLTTVLNISIECFAQDPFTAIAVGGLTGASGAGLFGSMAAASGVDIGWSSGGSDPMDAMWNVLNPDHVYFSGEKHEATNVGEDVYHYIEVDIEDWLQAQHSFITEFISENNVTDNSSGTVVPSQTYSFDGLPMYPKPNTAQYISDQSAQLVFNPSNSDAGGTLLLGSGKATFEYLPATTRHYLVKIYFGNTIIFNADVQMANGNQYLTLRYYADTASGTVKLQILSAGQYTFKSVDTNQTLNTNSNIPWTSSTVNENVFDNWESAKVKIPSSISQLQAGWTLPDFLDELDRIWTGAGEDNIIIEDGGDVPPVPPQPLPDTPLGEVPFDDWVDLWGQSIWDNLTRIEEKAELMVINQEDGLESIDDLEGLGEDILEGTNDLVGLATDIDENLEDMITYEQGISEDVEDIGENVEDIEDEVIVIVDEMGNVIDVLEGIDAKIYAQGQTIGSISTEVGTVADAAEAIQTEVETQTETQEDIKEAVEDLVPYVVPLPDIATDTETMVDILPDIATATQTSTQTLTDTLPDIKDATETITETLPDIITEIQDATTTLTDDIPNIDDICLNIDEAPYKDLETGVDRLPRFMLPFITDLRSALGIWHYVTEWLAQISTTFAFISGCLVGTSIMTPIYAAIAGFMCIKVYRRMCS